MLTQAQIEQFVAIVEEEAQICIDEQSVMQTRDDMADFVEAHGAPNQSTEGLSVWFRVQAAKGQQRRDLCVYDFGDFRAAVTA